MSSTPLVTILTPSFNTGRYIGEAIESVLTQGYRNVEYLVFDAGSTDNTLSELKRFGSRVKWVSERDRGQADALNKGFLRAKGSIFAWLNADDTLAANAITSAVEYLWSNPDVALVYGDANFIDAKGEFIARCAHVEPYSRHRLLHYSDFIVQPAAFFRKSAFEAVGGIDTSLNWAFDYDLWIKMAVKGLKLSHLPKVLANYRWLADAKTASGAWPRLREIESVVGRYAEGSHGYLRLETVNQHLQDAGKSIRRFRLIRGTGSLFKAVGTYATSARAIRSTFQGKTWKIIYTGQVLRKRALAAEAKEKPKAVEPAPLLKKPAPPAPRPAPRTR
jgi:glycosyltransferase involved in cell wall biosynthesis